MAAPANERLSGKTALISGGANGIGRAIARRFASEGASVMIVDLAREAGEQVAGEIRAEGGRAEVSTCDVSSSKAA